MSTNYEVTLTSDKSVYGKFDEVKYTATVKSNGVPVVGAMVVCDASYIADGPSYTNSSGVAKFVCRVPRDRYWGPAGSYVRNVYVVEKMASASTTIRYSGE